MKGKQECTVTARVEWLPDRGCFRLSLIRVRPDGSTLEGTTTFLVAQTQRSGKPVELTDTFDLNEGGDA